MPSATKKNPWAFPGSRLVLKADAPRELWLRARLEGLGGSDVSKVLGLSKYGSAYSVWLEKTGIMPADPDLDSVPMKMGRLLEPIVKQLFTEETGLRVRSAGLHRSKDHPFMQVTIDGAIEDGGIIECKTTTGWLAHEWADGQTPDHAELQLQHGLAVTGRSHGYATALIDGRDFQLRYVERDEALIRDIIKLEEEFWTVNVQGRVAPPVTPYALPAVMERYRNEDEPAEPIDLDRDDVAPLRARIEENNRRISDLEADTQEAQAALRHLAGGHAIVTVDGEPFATLKSTGTFASSKFAADHPDKAAKYSVLKPVVDTKALAAAEPALYNHYRSRVLRFQTPKTKKD